MRERSLSARRDRYAPVVKHPPFDGSAPSSRGLPRLPTRSLVDAGPGDVVKIDDIFFQIVRNRCWELGIDRGELFECRGVRDGCVVLEHEDHGRVRLEAHYARFVSTVPVASGVEIARIARS